MEIEGYPNYLIYDDGRVWSIPRRGKAGRFLRPATKSDGYLMVSLVCQRKSKSFNLHRLVAEHYIPNPENKPTVDHKDRNPLNNHISNLRWATRVEQARNKGMLKTNTSGHTNITEYYNKAGNHYWFYSKRRVGHDRICEIFKSKIDAICYKYIALLKIKAGLI